MFAKRRYLLRILSYVIAGILIIVPILTGCESTKPPESTSDSNSTHSEGDNKNNAPTTDESADIKPSGRTPGYYSMQYYDESENGASFLVCGTNGRLDRIFEDGTVENIPLPGPGKDLTHVLVTPDITLVGGFSGALFYSLDGKTFEPCNGAGKFDILCITVLNSTYYASTDDGTVLSSADGVAWRVKAKLTDKPLISIAAGSYSIMAITEDTDMFKSEDGENWDLQNYNEIYHGLSQELVFKKLVNLQETFMLLCVPIEAPDTMCIMVTYSEGEVWSTLMSREINNRDPSEFNPITINAVCFSETDLLAACDRGRIMTYTDCPSCNLINEVSSYDLRCIAINNNKVIVAGDNFEFKFIDADSLRWKEESY